jgi:hypothetical protein
MNSTKMEVEALLRELPDDCTLEDIQYHLYVIDKIKHSMERMEAEGAIDHEEAVARLSRWIIE